MKIRDYGNFTVNVAGIFAMAAHEAVGQKRKYTGEPYIVHPVEVCDIVMTSAICTPDMQAAALLHDVVEDTDVKMHHIIDVFGYDIANLVAWLTDVSKPTDGNRETRKRLDREHTWKAPYDAQTIKVADLIANAKDILAHDEHFAVVYMKEKRLLLEGMNADQKLMDHAWKIVHDYERVRS